MIRIAKRRSRWTVGLGVFAALALLASCAGGIRWISDYDETTDKSLTVVQQKADDFIARLEKDHGEKAASFDQNKAFYEDIDKELRRLEFRVASIPKNDQSIRLVSHIRQVVLGTGTCSTDGASLRDLHCLKENASAGPSLAALEIARRNVNTTISAALQLELAKKQGSEK